jgi:anaerobic selenocysteine-containing dehydrogenase
MPVYTTACPRNCYSTCTMRVQVEDGRLRRIEPHPDNKATPEGVCLKGLSYYERVHSPDRILHPLYKRPDGQGFEPVSWDEALDLIAERLVRVREETGPQGMLYYQASGTKGLMNAVGMAFWRLYGGCTTTYGDLCWPAGLEATRLTLGDNKHSAPWDLANARLIVLWGKNAAETNIHQMPFVQQAVERGGRLVVIDPRRTETAERAALFLQPRPGTDGALVLAIAHLLIAKGNVDRDFIGRHVLGFDEFAALVRDRTPEWAAEISDVPPEKIRRFAQWFGTSAPVTISPGFGMQRYTNSGQTMRAMLALLAVTGNIGKPGAGWVYANLQTQIFEAVKDPFAFYPPERSDGVVRVSISTSRLGQEMLATRDPPLRMAWVERGNPVTQNPETNTVLRAFRALEFRVVVDQFLTDTAREADLILPAKTMFEQSDVIGAYWHPYIQLKQKVIDPPGEVRPESAVYWELARRLGIAEEDLAGKIPAPSDAAVEAFLEERLAPFPELTLERLREGPVLVPGHQEVAFSDYRFATPSGKIELVSEEAVSRWGVDRLPGYVEPVESVRRGDRPRPDATDTRGPDARVIDAREPAAGWARRYPLYLMTPNTKNRIHSQFNNLRMIRQFGDRPLGQVHPDDAAARSIVEGDRIRIFNDRGSFEVEARLDPGIKPGCVAVTNGWWISEGGTVNFCSLGRETDLGHGAAFHETLVEIARLDGVER